MMKSLGQGRVDFDLLKSETFDVFIHSVIKTIIEFSHRSSTGSESVCAYHWYVKVQLTISTESLYGQRQDWNEKRYYVRI